MLSEPGEAYAAANTMAFATLTLCQLFHAYDVRSERSSLLQIGIFSYGTRIIKHKIRIFIRSLDKAGFLQDA